MAGKTGFYLKQQTIDIDKFDKYSKAQMALACDKAALEMLQWMANGSMKNGRKPPIRWGVLAASGSAFRGGKFLGDTSNLPVKSNPDNEKPSPNKAYASNDTNKNHMVMTFGFNTDYAIKMHEEKAKDLYKPGKYSEQSGPEVYPGNQWVTSHLDTDKDDLQKIIAAFLEAAL